MTFKKVKMFITIELCLDSIKKEFEKRTTKNPDLNVLADLERRSF